LVPTLSRDSLSDFTKISNLERSIEDSMRRHKRAAGIRFVVFLVVFPVYFVGRFVAVAIFRRFRMP
jgi:hypothetical protein